MTIKASDVTHRYGDLLALRGVSFEVGRGEVFGLLGPNGAGKTTLLRILAGILVPASGRAFIDGVDVQADPLAAKARLGFLSGDTALYARLTVRETLDYFASLHGMEAADRLARIRVVTADLGLEAFLDQRCGSLSSGQRQRANLARAFVTDPPVLILDEPTVALDVISGQFVMEAIARARAAGKAVLFSTHIMSEVEALCDRIGLLLGGEIRAAGPHDQLIRDAGVRSMTELIVGLGKEPPR